MMCQRIGRWPTGTIGLGRTSVSSRNRVPSPPHRTNTGTSESLCFTDLPLRQLPCRAVPRSDPRDSDATIRDRSAELIASADGVRAFTLERAVGRFVTGAESRPEVGHGILV